MPVIDLWNNAGQRSKRVGKPNESNPAVLHEEAGQRESDLSEDGHSDGEHLEEVALESEDIPSD